MNITAKINRDQNRIIPISSSISSEIDLYSQDAVIQFIGSDLIMNPVPKTQYAQEKKVIPYGQINLNDEYSYFFIEDDIEKDIYHLGSVDLDISLHKQTNSIPQVAGTAIYKFEAILDSTNQTMTLNPIDLSNQQIFLITTDSASTNQLLMYSI